MGKMSQLNAQGVTDLYSYNQGVSDTEERILTILMELENVTFPGDVWHINPFTYAINLIKESK